MVLMSVLNDFIYTDARHVSGTVYLDRGRRIEARPMHVEAKKAKCRFLGIVGLCIRMGRARSKKMGP